MKTTHIITALFISISYIGTLHATSEATCTAYNNDQTHCPAGCYYKLTTNECKQCGANTYSDTAGATECTSCPQSGQTALAGSTSKNACKLICDTKDIQNGTWAPNTTPVYGENPCQYTNKNKVTCNNTTNDCTGYHVDGSIENPNYNDHKNKICISNKIDCKSSEGHRGKKFFNRGDNICYYTSCASGHHTYGTATEICSTNYYTSCISNTQPCNSAYSELGNCQYSSKTGIAGDMTWKSTGGWNYNDCTCSKERDISNGMGVRPCTYKSGTGSTTEWDESNCGDITSITKCNKGYCQTGDAKDGCNPARTGYWSGENTVGCNTCPNGATTDGTGKSEVGDCMYKGGTDGTQFCDKAGNCFTLPTGVNISHK